MTKPGALLVLSLIVFFGTLALAAAALYVSAVVAEAFLTVVDILTTERPS